MKDAEMKSQTNGLINGISDAAVAAKTGKNWSEWFGILDRAGAAHMQHREIAAYLHAEQHTPDWWSQMITVGYEQERGLRQKHQKPDGYEVSASKTINVPLPVLFEAWENEAARSRWFPRRKFKVRKATPNKSLRLSWGNGTTQVEVSFHSKGESKSQVTCQHSQLSDFAELEKMRTFWAKTLATLKEKLEPSP